MYFRWVFCLLGLTIPFFAEFSANWLTHVFKTIAKYGYGVYLTHQFTMTIAFVYLRNPLAKWAAFLSLAFLLPFLAYHLIERPGFLQSDDFFRFKIFQRISRIHNQFAMLHHRRIIDAAVIGDDRNTIGRFHRLQHVF